MLHLASIAFCTHGTRSILSAVQITQCLICSYLPETNLFVRKQISATEDIQPETSGLTVHRKGCAVPSSRSRLISGSQVCSCVFFISRAIQGIEVLLQEITLRRPACMHRNCMWCGSRRSCPPQFQQNQSLWWTPERTPANNTLSLRFACCILNLKLGPLTPKKKSPPPNFKPLRVSRQLRSDRRCSDPGYAEKYSVASRPTTQPVFHYVREM